MKAAFMASWISSHTLLPTDGHSMRKNTEDTSLWIKYFKAKSWEKKRDSVTSRSHGYRDVTAMYIRKSKILSRIYAKHQYRQESEFESIVVIYIPTEKYKYVVITESDTIL